jgi:hypothetical protein
VPWLQPLMEEAQMIVQQVLKDSYEAKLEEGRALPTDEAIQMILDRFQAPEAAIPVIA